MIELENTVTGIRLSRLQGEVDPFYPQGIHLPGVCFHSGSGGGAGITL